MSENENVEATSFLTSLLLLDLSSILFSNDILNQLFGYYEDDAIDMDMVRDGIVSPGSTSVAPLPNAALLHDTLCITRFNRDAGNLSALLLKEYRDILPLPHEMDTLTKTLGKRTALSSTRSDLHTVLDSDAFASMVCQHTHKLMQLDSQSNGVVPASEVFYIACALFYASSLNKSSSEAKDRYMPFVIKLDKRLTGLNPSLMLMQACRLWSMGCMQCNLVEEAASAVIIGGQAAVSMGIHKHEVMVMQPEPQRPLFTDALINLVCDGCVMRAIFAVETPIYPASLHPTLFNAAQDEHEDQAAPPKPMPLILRLHASSWIFIGRYYHRQGRLRVPTAQDLTPPAPVEAAEEFETSQLSAISTILHHCALELERPLASWLSAVSFQQPSQQQQQQHDLPLESNDCTAQSIRALHMLYLIRYYRILINYPFISIKQDSREAVMEAARSTINTTWRLARHGATRFHDNLALYGHICLRAIAFLAACRFRSTTSTQEVSLIKMHMSPDKDEQVLADLELGVDALDKLDRVLNDSVSMSSIASAHLLKMSSVH